MPHTHIGRWGKGGGPWRGHRLVLFLESLRLSSEATPSWVSFLDLGALLALKDSLLLVLGSALSLGLMFFPRLQLLAAVLVLGSGLGPASSPSLRGPLYCVHVS